MIAIALEEKHPGEDIHYQVGNICKTERLPQLIIVKMERA
jgi:hypothetical protein